MMVGRYYITPRGTPYFNMALDEWLFSRVRKESEFCGVILRLYSWKSEAITIGYNQLLQEAVDFSRLGDNVPIIRRITGGRAIYHDSTELTFSFSLNSEVLPCGLRTLSETNKMISDSVVEILNSAGINATGASRSDPSFKGSSRFRNKSCFGSLARYEIVSDGSKIAAGAQRRIGSYLIHQGSIKINGISECPAIGQTGEDGKKAYGSVNKRTKNYALDEFSVDFGRVFSSNLGMELENSEVSKGDGEEIERFRLNLVENILNRRRFV